MPALPIAREKLDAFGIDAVCEAIGERKSLTLLAQEQEVSIGSLLTWIEADPERSARVKECRIAMARYWDERAEEVLERAPDEFGLKKARELSQHYRWRASKTAPRDYGDRQVLAGDPDAPLHGLSDEALDARLKALLPALDANPAG